MEADIVNNLRFKGDTSKKNVVLLVGKKKVLYNLDSI